MRIIFNCIDRLVLPTLRQLDIQYGHQSKQSRLKPGLHGLQIIRYILLPKSWPVYASAPCLSNQAFRRCWYVHNADQ